MKAIDSYVRTYGPKKIDMLIVSHFHEDHINGVKELLKQSGAAKQVILPYLYPEERLMIAAEYSIMHGIDDLTPEYTDFLADPIQFFLDSGVDEIIFLVPGSDSETVVNSDFQSETDTSWSPDSLTSAPEPFEIRQYSSGKVSFRKHDSVLYLPKWMFKFHCPPKKTAREKIVDKLKSLKLPIDVTSNDDLRSVIKTDLHILKDVYYSLFDGNYGQNSTSIVCMHGPSSQKINERNVFLNTGFCSDYLSSRVSPSCFKYRIISVAESLLDEHSCERTFTLLTGDSDISAAQLQTAYKSHLENAFICLVPHHGSRRSFDRNYTKEMPNCSFWITSFGLGNKFGHPSKTVVDYILDEDRSVLPCNEYQVVTVLMNVWIG